MILLVQTPTNPDPDARQEFYRYRVVHIESEITLAAHEPDTPRRAFEW